MVKWESYSISKMKIKNKDEIKNNLSIIEEKKL